MLLARTRAEGLATRKQPAAGSQQLQDRHGRTGPKLFLASCGDFLEGAGRRRAFGQGGQKIVADAPGRAELAGHVRPALPGKSHSPTRPFLIREYTQHERMWHDSIQEKCSVRCKGTTMRMLCMEHGVRWQCVVGGTK